MPVDLSALAAVVELASKMRGDENSYLTDQEAISLEHVLKAAGSLPKEGTSQRPSVQGVRTSPFRGSKAMKYPSRDPASERFNEMADEQERQGVHGPSDWGDIGEEVEREDQEAAERAERAQGEKAIPSRDVIQEQALRNLLRGNQGTAITQLLHKFSFGGKELVRVVKATGDWSIPESGFGVPTWHRPHGRDNGGRQWIHRVGDSEHQLFLDGGDNAPVSVHDTLEEAQTAADQHLDKKLGEVQTKAESDWQERENYYGQGLPMWVRETGRGQYHHHVVHDFGAQGADLYDSDIGFLSHHPTVSAAQTAADQYLGKAISPDPEQLPEVQEQRSREREVLDSWHHDALPRRRGPAGMEAEARRQRATERVKVQDHGQQEQ